nr:PREDICTED: uncharacterized protein LOC107398786 [Tribolium castaneum]|eukprot:XP_015839645.1 PREDICTED: uncharacterized protein LOC107398786 [Tribolium castaneum]
MAMKQYPFLYKIFLDFAYAKIGKMVTYSCIIIQSLALQLQVYFIVTHFSKELIVKYGPGVLVVTYLVTSLVVELMIENKTRKIIDFARLTFWPTDFCGLEAKNRLIKNSSKVSIVIYLILMWFAAQGIVMFPVWGDTSEWRLHVEIFDQWKLFYYIYVSTFTIIVFSAVRLPGILLYSIFQTHMQIVLINQKITQISQNDPNDIRMMNQTGYQKRIYKEMCLCVSQHIAIKRYILI